MTANPLLFIAETLMNKQVVRTDPLHGGDLSTVCRLTLQDGDSVVAKAGPLVGREARMLQDIATTGARVPRVLGVKDDVLLLQDLAETGPTAAGWESLGETLRHLHRTVTSDYGRDEDYAFGPVKIRNTPNPDWVAFWTENRLLDAVEVLPADLATRLERLARTLPDLLPRSPRPSLLHGDLWSGNVLFSGRDAWLIDPASYVGHAEVDLAMLALFGSPGPGFADAYGPPEPGWQERQNIYQLWPALVHLRLFGSSYRGMVNARLTALGV
jgi:fructosamine-3-kinase